MLWPLRLLLTQSGHGVYGAKKVPLLTRRGHRQAAYETSKFFSDSVYVESFDARHGLLHRGA
jgi:hypothetical protein